MRPNLANYTDLCVFVFFFQEEKTFVKTCLLLNWKKELFFYQTFYNKYLVHLHFFKFAFQGKFLQ